MKKQTNIEIINKKAAFNYLLLDTYKAGMVLYGTEVKSIREGKVNMSDCYCFFKDGELWVKNLHIAEYAFGTYNNHVPLRQRKLLLQKRELQKLHLKIKEKGFTIIPYRIYFNERNLCKIDICLAKGKKSFDKRETLKAKDEKRDVQIAMKKYR
ncbi:MAG: SsrA-binding protein SmpB [Sphingobacteriales bacterium]|jgi:SsrA-binding protein|nr:MAG: SsrA-binding protein SmpB [Sphingobacteriales bacterium]